MAGSLGAAARAPRKDVGLIVRPCDPGAHHFWGQRRLRFCLLRVLVPGMGKQPRPYSSRLLCSWTPTLQSFRVGILYTSLESYPLFNMKPRNGENRKEAKKTNKH